VTRLYIKLINMLMEELSKTSSTSTTRTYIQGMGAICRQQVWSPCGESDALDAVRQARG